MVVSGRYASETPLRHHLDRSMLLGGRAVAQLPVIVPSESPSTVFRVYGKRKPAACGYMPELPVAGNAYRSVAVSGGTVA